MKIASKKAMVTLFGKQNVEALENEHFDFSHDLCENPERVKFYACINVKCGEHGEDDAMLYAFIHQDINDVNSDDFELDMLSWDDVDYYAYDLM